MAQQPKHTPGPWTVYESKYSYWPGIEAAGISIVAFGDRHEDEAGVQGRLHEEALANAALIAAAPDMAAAIKALIEPFATMSDEYLRQFPDVPQPQAILAARAALAKAGA